MKTPPLERFLTYRLHVVNKITDRDTNRAYLSDCDIPLGEARCLAAIGRYAPLSVNDLARTANLNKGQASRSAQALVDRGLVEKTLSASDGRGVVLTPTASGLTQYQRIIDLIARRNDEIFACLSADEQRLFGNMLDRLIEHVQSPAEGAED
ncbi:MarR family winged helix-turn-helix transcriptional regulator [Achromobacter seleniivolatilans]|uniref:MarR family winged helix-turn-helix transcriptional regulator n=1 Tax=Achromobacter seleniivolatilans TaxID=3047478 RepID=A0ABY9LUP3_9BURK|nr:MarR family winged helix-turn-helix transcriptional regulator [Achromobacter sp. R39]WMD18488.1 MarR family winged helix-turn-helix transcriptional regulator [Achromobacter sp. R39]